ncbi:hypothetical protein ACXGQW_07855 [Wenyingzhuangia sp. IMCC45533]
MKKIILNRIFVMMILFSSCVESQVNRNLLTLEDYSSIKINNVALSSINDTKGLHQSLNNLFNTNFQYSETNIPDNYREVFSNDLKINFLFHSYPSEYNYPSGYEISSINVLSDNIQISILGKSVKLGGTIDSLENFNINKENSIIFQLNPNSSNTFLNHENFLLIKFDKNTRLITKIEFVVMP